MNAWCFTVDGLWSAIPNSIVEFSNAPTMKSAMAFPVRGSTIEDALSKRGCHASPPSNPVINLPNKTEAELVEIRAKIALAEENMLSGMNGDALLYLGPAATLTRRTAIQLERT